MFEESRQETSPDSPTKKRSFLTPNGYKAYSNCRRWTVDDSHGRVQAPPPIHTIDEEESEEMKLYRSKYAVLISKNDSLGITFPEGKTIEEVKELYDLQVNRVVARTSLPMWKGGLLAVLLAMEFAGTFMLGNAVQGFAESQMRFFLAYEKLLVELGEKYSSPGEPIQVELRLMALIAINAVIVIFIGKMSDRLGLAAMGVNPQQAIRMAQEQAVQFISGDPIGAPKGGLANLFTGQGDFFSNIAGVATSLFSNINTPAAPQPQQQRKARRRVQRGIVFEDDEPEERAM